MSGNSIAILAAIVLVVLAGLTLFGATRRSDTRAALSRETVKKDRSESPFLDAPLSGGDVVDKYVPFTVSYQAVRDVIAAVIYIVFLLVQGFLWTWWQRRGVVKPKQIPRSAYGRPLLKPAKTAQPEEVGA